LAAVLFDQLARAYAFGSLHLPGLIHPALIRDIGFHVYTLDDFVR